MSKPSPNMEKEMAQMLSNSSKTVNIVAVLVMLLAFGHFLSVLLKQGITIFSVCYGLFLIVFFSFIFALLYKIREEKKQ